MRDFVFKKPLGTSYTRNISKYYWNGNNLDTWIIENNSQILESYGDRPSIITRYDDYIPYRIEWDFGGVEHRLYGPANISMDYVDNYHFRIGKQIYCYDNLILKQPRFTKEIIATKVLWGKYQYEKQIKSFNDWLNFDHV